ncbi:OTU domain-containing deubiquitinating enzyme [Pseudoscourfieldia marina]
MDVSDDAAIARMLALEYENTHMGTTHGFGYGRADFLDDAGALDDDSSDSSYGGSKRRAKRKAGSKTKSRSAGNSSSARRKKASKVATKSQGVPPCSEDANKENRADQGRSVEGDDADLTEDDEKTIQEKTPPPPPPAGKTQPQGGNAGGGGQKSRATVTLGMLVDAGALTPGVDKLSVKCHGHTHKAELLQDGRIRFQEITFESPSAFSLYCKRMHNPTRRADDGWGSVTYDGVTLGDIKKKAQEGAGDVANAVRDAVAEAERAVAAKAATKQQSSKQNANKRPPVPTQPAQPVQPAVDRAHLRRAAAVVSNVGDCDEDVDMARALLDSRLEQCKLVEKEMASDGNCQFRALADQLYSKESVHAEVRQKVVQELSSNRERYEPFVDGNYDVYVTRMQMDKEWGDGVTLQAASDAYGVNISVITSYSEKFFIELTPEVPKMPEEQTLRLSLFVDTHYNSVYPSSEPAAAAGA